MSEPRAKLGRGTKHLNTMTKHEERVHQFAQVKNGQIEKHEKAYFIRHDTAVAVWEYSTKRPQHYYRFKTEQEREQWIQSQKDAITQRADDARAYREKKQKENESLKVGQIMYDSWGWEQTNIDFYIIVRRTKAAVWLQKIGASIIETGFMSGNTEPMPEKLIGEPFMRRIGKYGLKIESHRGTLRPHDGKPKSCSWYA